MKIIKKDNTWNHYDDILICENIHPLYTKKIIKLLEASNDRCNLRQNVNFVTVADNYVLHKKEVAF